MKNEPIYGLGGVAMLSVLFTVVLALEVAAQGQIGFDNGTADLGGSPNATSRGLFWRLTGTNLAPETATALHGTLLGSASAASSTLAALPVVYGPGTSADVLLDGIGGGVYLDDIGMAYYVPGAFAGDSGYFQVEVWEGNYPSLAAAMAAGAAWGVSPEFSTGLGSNDSATPSLTGMPAVILAIPEPSPLALTGLASATLWVWWWRRRRGVYASAG